MSATGATLQPPITRVQARYARLPYGWPLTPPSACSRSGTCSGSASLIWFFLAIPMMF